MEKLFKSKKFKIFVIVLAVLLAVMLYCAATDGIANMPQKLLGFITTPFKNVSSYISYVIENGFGKFSEVDEAIKENEEYRTQIDELTKQLVDYKNLKAENERLRDIVGIKDENPDFEFVDASVVGRDPNTKYDVFTISKGSMQGISPRDPVITSSGLVGWVEEVGLNYSVVRTLLSPQIDVGAYTFDSECLGVVSGKIDMKTQNEFVIEYLENEPKVGELVLTAGESGFYPKDLVIGKITKTSMQKHGASYYAVIEPFDDIAELQHVFVITDFLGQGETIE